MKDPHCVQLLVLRLPPYQGGDEDQYHPYDRHQGQKKKRTMW